VRVRVVATTHSIISILSTHQTKVVSAIVVVFFVSFLSLVFFFFAFSQTAPFSFFLLFLLERFRTSAATTEIVKRFKKTLCFFSAHLNALRVRNDPMR